MRIKQDLLHITNAPTKDDGERAEPEEQTVSRVLVTEFEAAGTNGKTSGVMQGSIVAASQVSDFSRALRYGCATCKHFDMEGFASFLNRADHPAAPMHVRETVNSMRAALLQTMNASVNAMHAGQDGDMDVEHALRALGFCRALSESVNEPVIVHPLSSCPPESITETRPQGYYVAKDSTSEKVANSAYDSIMARAAGKLP